MFQFTFQVDPNETQFNRAFSRFGDDLNDFSELWPVLIGFFERIEQEQFATEGKSGSGGWPALSPAYAERKALQYPGAKILQRTMALNNALTQSGAGGALRIMQALYMIFGVDVNEIPYARFHQTGTGKMPMRKPVQLNEANKKDLMQIIHRFLQLKAKNAFSKEAFAGQQRRLSQIDKLFARSIA